MDAAFSRTSNSSAFWPKVVRRRHEKEVSDNKKTSVNATKQDPGFKLIKTTWDPQKNKRRPFDVTLAVHAKLDKLWVMAETCRRWRGPIAIALSIAETTVAKSAERVVRDALEQCDGLSIAVVRIEKWYAIYPVNFMRNTAIRNAKTTHYIMLDADLLPSEGLRERMLGPEVQPFLFDTKLALVIPAFEVKGATLCQGDRTCKSKLYPLSETIPTTRTRLYGCVHYSRPKRLNEGMPSKCTVFHGGDVGQHGTTRSHEWFNQTAVRLIPCVESGRYEPYYLVAKKSSTPLFDERFSGYGKNKVQHFYSLRWSGFKFGVLPHGFVVHVPHAESNSRRTWEQGALMISVNDLFKTFLGELAQKDPPITQRCLDTVSLNSNTTRVKVDDHKIDFSGKLERYTLLKMSHNEAGQTTWLADPSNKAWLRGK
jgi:hypothetical protein